MVNQLDKKYRRGKKSVDKEEPVLPILDFIEMTEPEEISQQMHVQITEVNLGILKQNPISYRRLSNRVLMCTRSVFDMEYSRDLSDQDYEVILKSHQGGIIKL